MREILILIAYFVALALAGGGVYKLFFGDMEKKIDYHFKPFGKK